MRIILDANVLFSAAKSDGAIREILRLLHSAGHVLVASDYVVEEARRNIVSKFPASESDLNRMVIHEIELYGTRRDTLRAGIDLVEKDRPVLAGAISFKCEVLVTGDMAHFGHLYGRTVEGTQILTPRMVFELMFPE